MTSVEELASARNRTVEEVLVACRAADVVAWSPQAPLAEHEVAAVDAVLRVPRRAARPVTAATPVGGEGPQPATTAGPMSPRRRPPAPSWAGR